MDAETPVGSGDKGPTILHFHMTEEEANALIRWGSVFQDFTQRGGMNIRGQALERALDRLDERVADQTASWEVCQTCDGSGWVEDDGTVDDEQIARPA